MSDSPKQSELTLESRSSEKPISSGVSYVKLGDPRPSEVYETYWRFAAERQSIFFRRLSGQSKPWTTDPILRTFKFTNAYRASDRVSQYLIEKIIYGSNYSFEDTCFRVLLFKVFNRIETWEFIESKLGPVAYSGFDWDHCEQELEIRMTGGERLYSAAYIMPSAGARGVRKHQSHLSLLKTVMRDGLANRVIEAGSLKAVYELLLKIPSFGPFLAYQFATDLAYAPDIDVSEMEFVMPGPGALDGIKKVFADPGDWSPADLVKLMADRQEAEFMRFGLDFPSLGGRSLQLIDCQNLFCEVDKYARVAHPDVAGLSGRTRIKQKYQPCGELAAPYYPPKWGINEKIRDQIKLWNGADRECPGPEVKGNTTAAVFA